MQSLGMGSGERQNASQSEVDGGDDASATDDAETDDTVNDAEEAGAEESTTDNDTGDTMPDDTTTNQQNLTVEDLAEHTMFSVETLEEMGEDMLEQLEQDVIAELLGSGQQAEGDGGGEGGGGSSEEQQANAEAEDSTNTDTQEEQTVTNSDDETYVTEEQLDSRLSDFEDRVTNSIGGTVEDKLEDFAEQQKQNAEKQEKARVVANAVEGLSKEGAESLPDEELNTLYEKHKGSQQRANMAAVPGEMNRNFEETTDDDAEYQDYPGGGRTQWQKRNSEGGD
jgi:hypothetical protein